MLIWDKLIYLGLLVLILKKFDDAVASLFQPSETSDTQAESIQGPKEIMDFPPKNTGVQAGTGNYPVTYGYMASAVKALVIFIPLFIIGSTEVVLPLVIFFVLTIFSCAGLLTEKCRMEAGSAVLIAIFACFIEFMAVMLFTLTFIKRGLPF
jgi:hypothetical protein